MTFFLVLFYPTCGGDVPLISGWVYICFSGMETRERDKLRTNSDFYSLQYVTFICLVSCDQFFGQFMLK